MKDGKILRQRIFSVSVSLVMAQALRKRDAKSLIGGYFPTFN